MKKKATIVLLITVVMALLLSACKMPLSTGPKTTPTAAGELPFPVTTQSDLVNQMLYATQTAIAAGGAPAEGQPTGETGGGAPVATEEAGGGAPAATQEAGGGAPAATEETGGGAPAATEQAGGGAPAPAATQEAGGGAPAGGQESGGGSPAQPAPQPTYQLPPEPARPGTYTLQKGEYPYCIARRYNISPAALLSANNLGMNTQVSIGTTLTLPADSPWNSGTRALRAHPTTYTVRQGDTMNSVACLFGDVYPEYIAAANGLQPGGVLTAGQTINIP